MNNFFKACIVLFFIPSIMHSNDAEIRKSLTTLSLQREALNNQTDQCFNLLKIWHEKLSILTQQYLYASNHEEESSIPQAMTYPLRPNNKRTPQSNLLLTEKQERDLIIDQTNLALIAHISGMYSICKTNYQTHQHQACTINNLIEDLKYKLQNSAFFNHNDF